MSGNAPKGITPFVNKPGTVAYRTIIYRDWVQLELSEAGSDKPPTVINMDGQSARQIACVILNAAIGSESPEMPPPPSAKVH